MILGEKLMAKYGYARVSTREQKLDSQIKMLNDYGCTEIFNDFGISGANKYRNGLQDVLEKLAPGDTLIVVKLDRLGRSLKFLLETVEYLKAKNCHLISLSEGINTDNSMGDLIFHIFGAIAEFERSLITERVNLGIAAAKAKGVKMGRKFKVTPEKAELMKSLRKEGKSIKEICNLFGITRATFYRHCT